MLSEKNIIKFILLFLVINAFHVFTDECKKIDNNCGKSVFIIFIYLTIINYNDNWPISLPITNWFAISYC